MTVAGVVGDPLGRKILWTGEDNQSAILPSATHSKSSITRPKGSLTESKHATHTWGKCTIEDNDNNDTITDKY